MNHLIPVLPKGEVITVPEKVKLTKNIFELQNEIMQHEQVECPLTNYFSEGLYAREIFIPKGTLLVGKIHKFKNLSIILKGKLTFFSIDGGKTVEAPHTFVANPGVKRVIYAHEDSIWMNVHATLETDLEKIENEVIAKDYSEVNGEDEETKNLIKEIRKCLGL